MRAHWLSILLWLIEPASTFAADGLPISLNVDQCVPGDREEFERLLFQELGTSLAAQPEASSDATVVTLSCADDGIALTVLDPITRKTMHRTLQVAQLSQPGSARLLALSVAEFVVASWVELSLQQTSPLEAVGQPVKPETLRAAQEKVAEAQRPPPAFEEPPLSPPMIDPTASDETSSLAIVEPAANEETTNVQVGAAFTWTQVLTSEGPEWIGGHLLFDIALPANLKFELAGTAMFGEQSTVIGRVTSNRIGGQGLLYYYTRDDVGLQLGLGYQFARFSYSASPSVGSGYRGGESASWIGGPLVSTRVSLGVGSQSEIGLRVDLGLFAIPVQLTVEGSGVVVDVSGAWISVAIDLMTGL